MKLGSWLFFLFSFLVFIACVEITLNESTNANGGETNGMDTNGMDTNGGETNGMDTNGGETNGMDTNMSEILFPGQSGATLRQSIRNNFWPTVTNGYSYTWNSMYSNIDNRGGYVRLVYTGWIYSNVTNVDHNVANTEHTWPNRWGGRVGVREADLHHLFPTLNRVNGDRAHKAFGDIDDAITERWWVSSTATTSTPASDIDSYSESTGSLFEPREDHKGNVARAMFYFYTLYGELIPSSALDWFYPQTNDLIKWHTNDQVDDYERQRNSRIKAFQGNDNPFILDPSLVERIF